MKTRRTIEFTAERSEIFVRREVWQSIADWCEACGARVQLLSPEEAARRGGVSPREIYQRVECGKIHFVEMPDLSLLICINSIF
ncbi:MAG TPA: hypothetical protein VJT71_20415 [Pyrinomonadaceae bacterium]|nr:hypothetical protein [Pyrinomonadaceae bacterium]